jgi:two-component system cell cycle sensor histidine kinase/response regulator CckA
MTVKSTHHASTRRSSINRRKAVRTRTSAKAHALYYDLSPDGILLIDAETQRVIEFNDAACRALGYTRAEFAGLGIADYEAIQSPDEIREHVQRALREGQIEFDTLQRTKMGEIRNVHVWAKTVHLDSRVVFHAIFRDITEHRQAIEAVIKSEARYRAVTESAAAAIITADSAGNIAGWNHAAERIFGYTAADIIGQPLTRLIPQYRELHLAGMNRIQSRGEPPVLGNTIEMEGLRKDQSEFSLELSVARWETSEGCFITGIIRDISERTRVQQRLRDSERLLKESQSIAGLGSYVTDLRTGRWISSAVLDDIFGIDDQFERSVEGWASIVHPAWQERMHHYLADEVLGRHQRFDMEYLIIRKRDGTARWVHGLGELELDANGHPLRMIGTISDITERKCAETAMRLQSAALQAAADAIVITDCTGVIEWVNPAFTQLTGYTVEEALGKNPRDLVKSGKHGQAFFADFWATILAGRPWHGEMTNRRKDGSLYAEDQTVTPILDGAGAITHFVAIKKDITERLQLEAQFRQAQKMESVGHLASGIAHDFNNLLTVINGMSELILEQVGQDDSVHADVEEIHRAGERAAALTRQLLAFSRQQILAPQVMNFNAVVAGMESLLRRLLGEDIDLVVVPAPGVGSVKADPGQIEQVIANLAVNARDAMPQGGQLTIETQDVTIDEHDARQHGVAVTPGSYAALVVSDSGIGMDEATRARIFEPFFTTKGPGKGTGLGLATVYGIVKQSHGFIWVYSEVGQGTSFKIYLPQVTEAAPAAHARPTVGSSTGTETILLVEDNMGLRKLATRFLEPAGYRVLGAATGEEALSLLERHQAPVHLLLSDVVMPGMSGRQLAEQLVQTRPGVKVLYMSGYTSDTIVRHGVLDAQVSFLGKPFTAATLLQKVREVLDS